MNTITGACMVPHPPVILPEVGRGEEKKIAKTRDSFIKVAKMLAFLKPETIVITTPHSVIYKDYFHISPGESACGDMGLFRAPEVKFNVTYDAGLAGCIADIAQKRGFPAGTEGEMEKELDHGVMVPLYFTDQFYRDYKLVRIGLSGLPLKYHTELGRIISDAVKEMGRRVFFIASGDLSHRLKPDGPYGFNEMGPVYDERIMEVMGEGRFDLLQDFDHDLLENAAECGHRSFCVMSGALEGLKVRPERLSHEDTFGVGYGVCVYHVEGDET